MAEKDLGMIDSAWAGWVLRRGVLCSPESWTSTPGDVRAIQFYEAQLAGLRKDIRDLKAVIERGWTDSFEEDQPLPQNWEYMTG